MPWCEFDLVSPIGCLLSFLDLRFYVWCQIWEIFLSLFCSCVLSPLLGLKWYKRWILLLSHNSWRFFFSSMFRLCIVYWSVLSFIDSALVVSVLLCSPPCEVFCIHFYLFSNFGFCVSELYHFHSAFKNTFYFFVDIFYAFTYFKRICSLLLKCFCGDYFKILISELLSDSPQYQHCLILQLSLQLRFSRFLVWWVRFFIASWTLWFFLGGSGS